MGECRRIWQALIPFWRHLVYYLQLLDEWIPMTSIHSLDNITYKPLQNKKQEFSLDIGMHYDLACFALWSGALERADEIIADLAAEFQIIADFEVHWSKDFYRQNIARFYERPAPEGPFVDWDSKVGPPPFRFLIVRDAHPRYTWKRSVSGIIEPSNERVVAAKYKYRDLFTKKYQIHSSNNIEEFLFQAVMVLGADRLLHTLSNPSTALQVLEKDLEGSGGWNNWQDLFDVMNIGVRYLVLRNFEGLPEQLLDTDIDFLCDNFQRLASLCAVQQKPKQPYKGKLRVAGEYINTDIRHIGDRYYPAPWQADMLQRRNFSEGFFVPAHDDLFFSILYHCKVQKVQVKNKYIPELSMLAEHLRFDWFDGEDLKDDMKCGSIISGYMRARGLYYEDPIDKGVQKNQSVISILPKEMSVTQRGKLLKKITTVISHPQKAWDFAIRKLRKLIGRTLMRS